MARSKKSVSPAPVAAEVATPAPVAAEVATPAPVAAEVATPAPAHIAQWASKTGKINKAYTETGLQHAPKAVRVDVAQCADFRALSNGQFTPMLREIVSLFTGQKLEGLRVSIMRAYDGTAPIETVRPNKGLMLALAQWCNDPVSYKNGIFTRFELTKKQHAIIIPLIAWANVDGVSPVAVTQQETAML